MVERTASEEKSEIPADVFGLEILPCLPARNLQTLKTVCKNWLQLINSPNFVKLHQSRGYRSRIRILITLPFENILEYNNYDDQEMKRIPYPGSRLMKIVGSADGLICLFDQKSGVLFNPSTGKCLQLYNSLAFNRIFCYWFGKGVDGEYVLVMGVVLSPGPRYELQVYKIMKSSKLKRSQSVSIDVRRLMMRFSCLDRGTGLVHGAVHWPVRRQRSRFTILAYDIYGNKYWEMSPPVQCDFRLGVLDGCLLAIVKNMVMELFEVWIMKDSWTKWANIEGFDNINSTVLSPLGFLPNGDLILDVDKLRLMKYNFDDNKATPLVEYGFCRDEAIMCADTLVSPSI